MIGTTLSHFRITAKLGSGGMGDVYRAEDTKLGREVAIKVLPEEMANDPERLERFQREARALAALDHPNIVSIYSVESVVVNDVGEGLAPSREGASSSQAEAESIHFLVMGLIEGDPLDHSVPSSGMALKDIFDLALPLVDAVSAAHEKGIVHRDLKPANVMVTTEGRVKVLDFGLAKLTESDAAPEMTQMPTEALTDQGVVMGTAPYMSPEQIEGKSIDPRTDIFSLGILLYEMATGERPFQGDTLAVLPFENGSGDPDAEYFSDGVTETIISSLSQLPDVKVISRTSAFHYKGQAINPQSVGEELGVQALVLGRIIQRGENLLVSAELVRASDSGQIWGQQYQRHAADIFDIQKEIAKEISTALRVELTSDQEDRLTRQHTENSMAYEAYLKGRQAWNRRTGSGFRQAIEHFQQAITADPTYALAYSGLADSYSLLGFYAMPPREVLPQAQAAAERALDLDDSLAEAHTSLAWIKMVYDWDLEGARHEFERAFELNSSYATMLHWYSILLILQDQPSASVDRIRTAFELDPLSRIINTEYVLMTALAGRFEESGAHFVIARNLDPNFGPLYTRQGWSLGLQGRYAESAEAYEEAVRLLGRVPYGLGKLGHAYAKAGRTDEAHEIIRQLAELSNEVYVSPIRFAFIYAGLGDLDHTFEWFEKAYEERTGEMVLLDFGPGSDLADDPRFEDLRRRIGLP